jgi:hypothetical protein
LIGFLWLRLFFRADAWLIATSSAAIGTLIYGLATRAWAVAILGQLFTAISAVALLSAMISGHPASTAALAPVAAMAATAAIFAQRHLRLEELWPAAPSLRHLARVYRLGSTTLLSAWAFEYVPGNWLTPFFILLGTVLICGGALLESAERVWTGSVLTFVGLAVFWSRFDEPALWPQLAAIALLLACCRLYPHLRRTAASDSDLRKAHAVLIVAALASVWLWVTRWVSATAQGGNLTVAWSVLALVLFVIGLGLGERIYRLGGLVILGVAIGRVFLVDVWRLETVYRILSFLVLGTVLLLLGFAYNRYGERIRRWW